MLLFHLEKAKYRNVWPPRGTLFADGRWNRAGQWILYTSPTIALAKLEILANENRLPVERVVMTIDVNEKAPVLELTDAKLSAEWMKKPVPPGLHPFTREWLEENHHLLIAVPSAQSQREKNYLIHVGHPRFNDWVRLVSVDPEPFDARLKS